MKKTGLIDPDKCTAMVRELAREVGAFIRKESGNFTSGMVESKGVHDFVSYVDKESESKLIRGLGEILPETGFITEEETTERMTKDLTWIIDPLDGTTNFIHGLPPYSISIALMEKENIILGVVYEIIMDECFYTWQGSPAYLNGTEIHVSETRKIDDSLIATGFPYTNYEQFIPYIESLKYFMRNSHGIRRLGSAAVDLAYLACGRLDAFWEYNLNAWDVAAGAFIIRQAGGCVTDFQGETNYLFGKEIVAANNLVFDEFLNRVGKFM